MGHLYKKDKRRATFLSVMGRDAYNLLRSLIALLRGIRGVLVYIDDILISSESETEHLQALEEVFKRLATAGLRAKKIKCKFMSPRVEFLGHVIDQDGIRPLPEKVRAVSKHHGR